MQPRRHPALNVDPHKPPAGWLIASGILQVDRTVRGYYTRRQEVSGRCNLRDCRRTCHIDAARIHAQGLGSLRMEQVKAWFRCQRLDGCGLVFHDDQKAESLKLSALCRRPAVAIQLRCGECKFDLKIPPEQMIGRLQVEGKGGGETEVHDLPGLLTGACKGCGKVAWSVQVAWPDPHTWGGQRTIDLARPTETGPVDPLDF
jgi:hypothetical protein